jgi:hypothetical protein
MTINDFNDYNWTLQHKDSYLEMNTFCSTSDHIDKAKFYMEASESKDKLPVLMKFSFLKTCCTAIRLYKFSDNLPCLSSFEDEREFLILPGTFFRVISIKTEKYIRTICLEHFNIENDNDKHRHALYNQNLPDY